MSLSEAEAWAEKHTGTNDQAHSATFSHASIDKPATDGVKLSQPRAYSLALAPHVVHAQSNLLAALVSSRLHNQLDFQAVGSWFILDSFDQPADIPAKISRVPSGREDIFKDASFDLRAKRALMKFLRFVQTYEDQPEVWETDAEKPFSDFLREKFGLPPSSHGALLALTLGSSSPQETTTAFALPKISRHLRSIGVFGAGFGAVLPKWGGLAEIAQVACRAGAVGGGVYVLNKGIQSKSTIADGKVEVLLSGGETISTSWLAGSSDDIPLGAQLPPTFGVTRSISIVTPQLSELFPPTSEGGVTPAGAVVTIPSGSADEPPVYIVAHSHESGECPSPQSKFHRVIHLLLSMMILRKNLSTLPDLH